MKIETPTPRTDAKRVEVQMQDLQIGHQLSELIDFARQLEQELNEAKEQQETKVTPALVMDYARVQAERDQLRKVADELANIIYLHSLRPQNALDGYNQLPHIQARKTK